MFVLFYFVLPILMTIELVCIVKSRTWKFEGFGLFLFIVNSLAMSYLIVMLIESSAYYSQ